MFIWQYRFVSAKFPLQFKMHFSASLDFLLRIQTLCVYSRGQYGNKLIKGKQDSMILFVRLGFEPAYVYAECENSSPHNCSPKKDDGDASQRSAITKPISAFAMKKINQEP